MQIYGMIYLLSLLLSSLVCMSEAQCDYNIVESMPEGLNLKDPSGANVIRTHESLLDMVEKAKKTLRIASFYWYLTPEKNLDGHPAVLPGRMLMDAIIRATKRGVDLQVIMDGNSESKLDNKDDLKVLAKIGTLKFLDMKKLMHAGIMHTKFMIADNQTFYLGSSNFDWRSYSEIKEMGLTFRDCPQLAEDLDKIFRTYMMVADMDRVPSTFSDDFKAKFNLQNPFVLQPNDTLATSVFIASSPPPFNGEKDWTGRTDDIDALLHLINSARHKICLSVMNYSPRMEFVWPKYYWPRIDDALRKAATTRGVKVELLFSNWTSTKPSEIAWYKSLNALQSKDFKDAGIHVRLFKVPAFDDYQKRIPFARVKHDKYFVTEGGAYIGTSNWTPDYFVNTAGVSMVIRPAIQVENSSTYEGPKVPVIKYLQDIFDRDFNSEYAHELD